jgi:hypothetical protein
MRGLQAPQLFCGAPHRRDSGAAGPMAGTAATSTRRFSTTTVPERFPAQASPGCVPGATRPGTLGPVQRTAASCCSCTAGPHSCTRTGRWILTWTSRTWRPFLFYITRWTFCPWTTFVDAGPGRVPAPYGYAGAGAERWCRPMMGTRRPSRDSLGFKELERRAPLISRKTPIKPFSRTLEQNNLSPQTIKAAIHTS